MEHPRPVVPVAEHALLRPALAHHVVQPQRLELGQGGALLGCHVRVTRIRIGVEHVIVGGGDVHVAAHHLRLRAGGQHVPQRGQPGQLVLVVVGIRHAPVGHVHRDHPDSIAGGRHRPRLGVRESRRSRHAEGDVVQAHPRQDGHPVPGRLAMQGHRVPAGGQLLAQQIHERVVRALGLLQADHVRPARVQPGQQARYALLDRVDVPGGYAHAR